MLDEGNEERQEEELSVLESIYVNEIISNTFQYSTRKLELQINHAVRLRITLTGNYPSSHGPLFEVLGRNITEQLRLDAVQELERIYEDSGGEVVLFDCIERCKDFFCTEAQKQCEAKNIDQYEDNCMMYKDQTNDTFQPCTAVPSSPVYDMAIHHGEPISDRKSTFQAHVCRVFCKEDVSSVLSTLLMDKKISRAHHPCMYAYRIERTFSAAQYAGKDPPPQLLLADNDDDGEHGAGSKLASLLDLLGAANVVVVVTRWYGGVHLGPDRFKHIANAARTALIDGGYVATEEGAKGDKKGKRGNHR